MESVWPLAYEDTDVTHVTNKSLLLLSLIFSAATVLFFAFVLFRADSGLIYFIAPYIIMIARSFSLTVKRSSLFYVKLAMYMCSIALGLALVAGKALDVSPGHIGEVAILLLQYGTIVLIEACWWGEWLSGKTAESRAKSVKRN